MGHPDISAYPEWVSYHIKLYSYAIQRKTLRENIFANCGYSWKFSLKFGSMVSFGGTSEKSVKVFSAKIVFSCNFSPYYGFQLLIYQQWWQSCVRGMQKDPPIVKRGHSMDNAGEPLDTKTIGTTMSAIWKHSFLKASNVVNGRCCNAHQVC